MSNSWNSPEFTSYFLHFIFNNATAVLKQLHNAWAEITNQPAQSDPSADVFAYILKIIFLKWVRLSCCFVIAIIVPRPQSGLENPPWRRNCWTPLCRHGNSKGGVHREATGTDPWLKRATSNSCNVKTFMTFFVCVWSHDLQELFACICCYCECGTHKAVRQKTFYFLVCSLPLFDPH